ncbi:hypothetical protein CVD28_03345 [Bacillus sp. M6-12]|uniref:hypothetical protein n=1 Tax=Bacillus sp. M6-12 TaxID=2054166 RepID=UPI000C75B6C2|nr:hypothetical protein [Bacillus sp. M6-12]PLS19465.1 hypothetical protein CVD28_03345 [Bacillus sp. M6-12]
MNSKYREFMQRQQMGNRSEGTDSGEESMRQMFGDSPDNQKFILQQPKKKKDRNVEDIPIPVKEGMIKKGYIIFGIILIIESIFLAGLYEFMSFIGGAIMAVLSFLFAWKVKYRYTKESNFYFYNLSVTLKGVLNHYRATAILFEQSEKIFIYSIALMAIQHFLLSWFSITSVLYSIGYYGMLLGIVLNLAKKKTTLLYKGLFLYSIFLLLMTVQNAFGGFHYVNYHTVISLFIFWYLAGLFQSLKIAEAHIDERDEDLEIDIDAQDEENDSLI